MQIPVALDESNEGEIFWMCASAHMAIYAIEMSNRVTLQPGSSHLFSENDFSMKYEVDQSSMNLPSFIILYYYLEGDVDMAH